MNENNSRTVKQTPFKTNPFESLKGDVAQRRRSSYAS